MHNLNSYGHYIVMVCTPKKTGYIGPNISKVYYAYNPQSRKRNSYYIKYDLFQDESPKLVLTLQAHTITIASFLIMQRVS